MDDRARSGLFGLQRDPLLVARQELVVPRYDFYSQSAHADNTWRIKAGGVFIVDDFPDQLNDDGTVRRFNPEAMRGVSDHLPMVMTLERAPE